MTGRRDSDSDGPTRPYPVLADEPGLMFRRPRRTLTRVLVLYALLPLICAAAGAFIAVTLSGAHTDDRLATLEADLEQRRAARAELDAAQQAASEAFYRDACVAFDRIQPRDAAVEEIRRRYRCTGGPPPSPSASPGVSPSPSPSPARSPGVSPSSGAGGSPTTGGANRPAPRPQPPPAAGPAPTPAPPRPSPSPRPPPPDLLSVCVLSLVCLRV